MSLIQGTTASYVLVNLQLHYSFQLLSVGSRSNPASSDSNDAHKLDLGGNTIVLARLLCAILAA